MGNEGSKQFEEKQRREVERLVAEEKRKYQQKFKEMQAKATAAAAAAAAATEVAREVKETKMNQVLGEQIQQMFAHVYGPSTSGSTAGGLASGNSPGCNSNISSLERSPAPYSYTKSNLPSTSRDVRTPIKLYPNLPSNNVETATHTARDSFTRNVPEEFVFVDRQTDRIRPSAPMASASFLQQRATTTNASRTRCPPKNEDEELNCPTCGNKFGVTIFNCCNGHSSCKNCRERGAKCGLCHNFITDMRNITLEAYVSERRMSCLNKEDGCNLFVKLADLDNHMKECPFNELACPLTNKCNWRGKINQIATHFDERHPENCQGNLDTELNILNSFEREEFDMHLINLGPYHFFMYLKTDPFQGKIYMTVQLVGTCVSASKWMYEIQVYNKREPRRKLTYSDICHSNSTPINEIFRESKCVIISQAYAMTYFSEGTLNYKYFVKKEIDKFGNQRGNRGRRGRGRGRGGTNLY